MDGFLKVIPSSTKRWLIHWIVTVLSTPEAAEKKKILVGSRNPGLYRACFLVEAVTTSKITQVKQECAYKYYDLRRKIIGRRNKWEGGVPRDRLRDRL